MAAKNIDIHTEFLHSVEHKLRRWVKFKAPEGLIVTKRVPKLNQQYRLILKHPHRGCIDHGILMLTVRYNYRNDYRLVSIYKLEDLYTDPFSITPEEATLFKLQYNLDYPTELINDL